VHKKKHSDTRLFWVELDLLDPEADIASLILSSDVVINCVGELNNSKMMREVNFELVKRIVDPLLTTQKKMHLIQLSSVGCYGAIARYRGKRVVINEASEERPIGEYEHTKTLADDYIREKITNYTNNIGFTIIRPTNVFGDNMKSDALRGLAGAVKKGRFFYIRDRKSVSTYVHVCDVASLILLCINNQEHSKNEVFIAADDSLQVNVINAFAVYFKVKKPQVVIPEFVVRVLSFIALKVSPSFPLETNVNSLLDFWRIEDGRKY